MYEKCLYIIDCRYYIYKYIINMLGSIVNGEKHSVNENKYTQM